MRRKIAAALLLSSLAFTTAARADEFFAVTPSGAAEALFPDSPKTVVGTLSSKCIDTQWTVMSSSETELVCEAPLNFGQSLVGQMLMGNSYSTPPRRFFRFNVAQISGISRVQASGWMELQMAFGQMKRTDFSGPEFQNGIIGFLLNSGGKLPVGTTFPNHVALGVQGDFVSLGNSAGLKVREVEPGSAAETAGIAVGDVVSRVAKKRFKNTNDDWLDVTANAAKAPTYEVEIQRAGKPLKLSLSRRYRPSITEQVQPVSIAQLKTAGPEGRSLADEVTKLAKLHADGALSDDEFQSAKARLINK